MDIRLKNWICKPTHEALKLFIRLLITGETWKLESELIDSADHLQYTPRRSNGFRGTSIIFLFENTEVYWLMDYLAHTSKSIIKIIPNCMKKIMAIP